MLHYILQTIAFQLFFLIIYDVFLKKETFFSWNRFYLLITVMASVLLPFIKFESIRTIVPEQFIIRLPEVIIGDIQPVTTSSIIDSSSEVVTSPNFVWSWDYLIYIGMVLACLLLLYKIMKLSVLIHKNPKRWEGNIIIVDLLKSSAAFSFFNYVFLGEWIKEEEKETILKHEQVHVTQKHSWDLLLFEVLRILFWFNPLIYMYQNRITTLHEYIADAHAMNQSNKKQYYEKLLSQVFDTEQISFTNTFFTQSLIKKRILMLSKSKSHRIHLLKYALLIPMVFGMLVYTSSYSQKKVLNDTELKESLFDARVEVYYKEILELSQKKSNADIIRNQYDIENQNSEKEQYIKDIDQVARMKAYQKYSADEYIRLEKEMGTFSNKDIEMVNKVLDRYKSYNDYLAYQKTDKAKRNWESNIRDGVLRLAVDDIKNLSEEEKKRQEEKIALIEKDDFFHSLLVTDGKSSTTMQIHEIDGKKIPGPTIGVALGNTNSNDIEVPFSIIDEVPTTEECKTLTSNEEKRICFSNYISDFVNKNFNTKLGKEFGLNGRQRITVVFKIGKDGRIDNIKSRAPHPGLEAEAIRVIRSLPQMIPGKHNGEYVIVPYSLPILFQVSE